MASVLHLTVGLASGRFYAARTGTAGTAWRPMIAFAVLSHAPDIDVWAFQLGIPYEARWGHRGATHSLLFAVVVGLAVALVAKRSAPPFRLTALVAIGVAASHGLLDSLTDGGLGVAFLWPFDATRYFLPWQPIPVAPIGRALLGARGFTVLALETVASAPLLVYAFWPRREADAIATVR